MDLLDRFSVLFCALDNCSSSNSKIEILNKTDTDLISLLSVILDKTKPFNIKSANILKRIKTNPNGMTHNFSLIELLKSLSDRTITGNTALDYAVYYLNTNLKHRELILKIIDKKLNVRITSTTLSKLTTATTTEFKVALGENLTPKIQETLNGDDYLVSRKLDGVRCIIFVYSKDNIKCFSRQNKEFFSCDNIKNDIIFTNPCVIDGEITIDDKEDNFKGVMEVIRRKETMKKCLFNFFDILTHEEFENHCGDVPLLGRLERNFKFKGKFIKKVPQMNFNFLDKMNGDVDKYKWEGLILRKNTGYKGKRTKDILKIKKFLTEEYRVISTENGIIQEKVGDVFKDTPALKHITVLVKDGVTCNVGSGFSIEERKNIYEDNNIIIGKIVSVQFFEKTIDGKLRFPIYKGIHGEEREL